MAEIQKDIDQELSIVSEATINSLMPSLEGKKVISGRGISKGEALTKDFLNSLPASEWFKLRMQDEKLNDLIKESKDNLKKYEDMLKERFEAKKRKIVSGDDLPPGVQQVIKVYLAVKRKIQPGDKLAGRHGNKGVISVVMPVEDMPYDENGEPVDLVLNPLGVPSRMNVGQLLEVHLGWASKELGKKIGELVEKSKNLSEVKPFVEKIYSSTGKKEDLEKLSDKEFKELCENLKSGVPMATPVFDGASEEEIKMLNERFYNKVGVTNVLAFTNNQETPESKERLIGEIAICISQIEKEAKMYKKAVETRLKHMIVHGVLHLFGFDHQKKGEQKEMEKVED